MHGHGTTLLLTIAFTENREVGTTKNVWIFMRIGRPGKMASSVQAPLHAAQAEQSSGQAH